MYSINFKWDNLKVGKIKSRKSRKKIFPTFKEKIFRLFKLQINFSD